MNANEITYAFKQAIAILQPKIEGKGKNKKTIVDPGNYFELEKFQFNEMQETNIVCKITRAKKYTTYKRELRVLKGLKYNWKVCNRLEKKLVYFAPKCSIEISGTNFGYICTPETIQDLWCKLSKLFEKCDVEILQPEGNNAESFETQFTIDKETIKEIKKLSNFVANDELRPAMNCICFRDNEITASNAVYLRSVKFDYSGSLLINAEGIKFISKCKEPVIISTSKRQIKIQSGANSIIIDKCDYEYPNYKSLYREFKYQAVINRNRLIEAIKQAAIFANQSSLMLKLNFSDVLKISGQDLDWLTDSSVQLPCNSDFSGTIAFKSSYLLTCLKAESSENVIFSVNKSDEITMVDSMLLCTMFDCSNDTNIIESKETEVKLTDNELGQLKNEICRYFGQKGYWKQRIVMKLSYKVKSLKKAWSIFKYIYSELPGNKPSSEINDNWIQSITDSLAAHPEEVITIGD